MAGYTERISLPIAWLLIDPGHNGHFGRCNRSVPGPWLKVSAGPGRRSCGR